MLFFFPVNPLCLGQNPLLFNETNLCTMTYFVVHPPTSMYECLALVNRKSPSSDSFKHSSMQLDWVEAALAGGDPTAFEYETHHSQFSQFYSFITCEAAQNPTYFFYRKHNLSAYLSDVHSVTMVSMISRHPILYLTQNAITNSIM